MLKWKNGCIVDITQEEEEAIKVALEDYKKRELKRPLEPHEVFNLLAKNIVNLVEIDDDTSLRMKDYYPIFNEIIGKVVDAGFKFTYKDDLWKVRQKHTPQEIYPPSIDTASLYYPIFNEIIGKVVDAGFKFTYKDDLWKVRQKHTPQEIYPPSIDTASLYERIDEKHAGTIDDPIPYDQIMQVFKGIYYVYKDVIYKCIRDSGLPLYAPPDSLIGNYFEVAEKREGE